MTASKVRTDYEQLAAIAQAFGQQAEVARQMLATLQSSMQTLQGGDWVGKGADKFYAEMTSSVLPALQRVVAAMNEAASTTAKISRVMKQAEDDSAALFRLDGVAESLPLGGTAIPGQGSGLAASLLGARADSGGSSGGDASQRFKEKPKKERKTPESLDEFKHMFKAKWAEFDANLAVDIRKSNEWEALKFKHSPEYEKRRAEFLAAEAKFQAYLTKEMGAWQSRYLLLKGEYEARRKAFEAQPPGTRSAKEGNELEDLFQKVNMAVGHVENLRMAQEQRQKRWQQIKTP